jgi:hypothetical protein
VDAKLRNCRRDTPKLQEGHLNACVACICPIVWVNSWRHFGHAIGHRSSFPYILSPKNLHGNGDQHQNSKSTKSVLLTDRFTVCITSCCSLPHLIIQVIQHFRTLAITSGPLRYVLPHGPANLSHRIIDVGQQHSGEHAGTSCRTPHLLDRSAASVPPERPRYSHSVTIHPPFVAHLMAMCTPFLTKFASSSTSFHAHGLRGDHLICPASWARQSLSSHHRRRPAT